MQDVKPTMEPRTKAQLLAAAIWRAPSSGRRSGELTPARATRIATAIVTNCAEYLNPWTIGGLARVESGFRTSAVSPSGRHRGLFQIHKATNVEDIENHTGDTCRRLLIWRAFCDEHHPTEWQEHSSGLCHWFGGLECSLQAVRSARRVHRWAARLRRLADDPA